MLKDTIERFIFFVSAETKDCTLNRSILYMPRTMTIFIPESSQEDVHEEEWQLLQGVVVRALGAVEVLVVLRTHGRVVNVVPLPQLTDAEGQDEVEDKGVDGHHHHVAVFAVDLDRGHGEVLSGDNR